ncbi:MAG TPA: glycosyltransferase family 4 protein [Gaiellaceae bacterium]|nr:glycosyltransferase family 4 protein [Gaiellaceae bacterium]
MTRVAFVSPEPTPYRSPLLDRAAALDEIDLTVIYAARSVASRTWTVEPEHRAVFLDGIRLPGVRDVFRHDYPVTPGILGALRRSKPDCVVVSGWSTFASQAAVAWCRARHVPYVLLVESHDSSPKPGWRRRVKETAVPPVVRRAASVLVTGTLARDSVVALGAEPERVRVFANTIDIGDYARRADELAARRSELRRDLDLADGDTAVLTVCRLAPEKGVDTLLRAAGRARDRHVAAVAVGDGPERARLEQLAYELGIVARLTGDRPRDGVIEAYAAADVFALLSDHEPWGVVVNEAAACGLPLVLSDRVGAARDLLRDGENGFLVPAGDVGAAAEAFRRLAVDPDLRGRMGARSRELVAGWGYEPSIENLLAAVREATASR